MHIVSIKLSQNQICSEIQPEMLCLSRLNPLIEDQEKANLMDQVLHQLWTAPSDTSACSHANLFPVTFHIKIVKDFQH